MIFPVPRLGARLPVVSSSFRSSDRPDHQGVDIMYRRVPEDGGTVGQAAPPLCSARYYMPRGMPALAMADGVLREYKNIGTGGYAVIDHAGGVTTQYMHLILRPGLKAGQRVQAGQDIGEISSNPKEGGRGLVHLHFQLRKDGNLVDPGPYIKTLPVVERRPGFAAVALALAALGGYLAWRSLRQS